MPRNISNSNIELFGAVPAGTAPFTVTHQKVTRIRDNQHIITAPVVSQKTFNPGDAVLFQANEIDFDFNEGPYDILALDIMIQALFGSTYNENMRVDLLSSPTQLITGSFATGNISVWEDSSNPR